MTDPAIASLKEPEAKKLARQIVEDGFVEFSLHAQIEMEKDNLIAADCTNLLRGGVYEPAEFVNNEWRYRVRTRQMCVVFTFRSQNRLRVVTAWRNKE